MPLNSVTSSLALPQVKDGGYVPGYIKYFGPEVHETTNWDHARDGFNDFISDVGDFFNNSNIGPGSDKWDAYEPGFDNDFGFANSDDPFVQYSGNPNDVLDGSSNWVSGDGSSAGSVGNVGVDDILSQFSNSASSNDLFMDLYKKTGDMSYLEKYVDNLVNRENTASARDYETQMSNTAFSRLVADIKNAGYNPWLALNANGASTPSVSASGVSQMSRSEIANSKENNIRSSLSNILGSLLGLMMVALIHSA